MFVDRAVDLADVFPTFPDITGKKEMEVQEKGARKQIEASEQEE